MKITWILNDILISGGVKAVFCLSNKLIDRGHTVNIIYPLIPMGVTPVKLLTKGYKAFSILKSRSNTKLWFDLKANLIRVPYLSPKYIPDADVVLATWWETAYFVNKLPASKGKKFYFIQHYEIWGGNKYKVNNSYRLGLTNIVNSQWVQDKVESVGGKVAAKILHAPDWEQFGYTDVPKHNGLRVLMPYRADSFKGWNVGLTAFQMARESNNNIQLVAYGREPNNLPQWIEYHQSPVGEELNRLYGSCDIFMFPSTAEGFGMPPMEAMCCKVPVVTTDVGAVRDYTIDGETA